MGADAARVAVLDDCPLLRHGVARVLEEADGPAFVLDAGSVDEATSPRERGEAPAGDVLLIDLRLSPGRLAEVVARLAGLGVVDLRLSSGPPDARSSPSGPASRAWPAPRSRATRRPGRCFRGRTPAV